MSEQQVPRLSECVVGFLISKQAEGASPSTLQGYRQALCHLTTWSDNRANLTPPDLKAFVVWLQTHHALAPKSVYNYWIACRSFYRWYAEETGRTNPTIGIKAPRVPEGVVSVLDEHQVQALLKACDYAQPRRRIGQRTYTARRPTALRDRALVLVLLDCGLRASEVCGLKVGDLELDTGKLLVRKGKGGHGRIVYAGKATKRALWRYVSKRKPGPTDPLFVTLEDRPLDRDSLRHLLDRLGKKAGIPGLHPHQFRHTFATQFLRNGGNLLALQRLLGHRSLEMVRRYVVLAEADLSSLHAAGSPADRWHL